MTDSELWDEVSTKGVKILPPGNGFLTWSAHTYYPIFAIGFGVSAKESVKNLIFRIEIKTVETKK